MALNSVGDIVRGGGKVIRLIPAKDFVARWRQHERLGDAHYKILEALLRRAAEDQTELSNALWDEAARIAGYADMDAAHADHKSYAIQNGTGEIIEMEQPQL